MKKIFCFLLTALGLLAVGARAQLSVGSTATLYVGSGATLSVNGAVQNAGTLTNAGHLFLRGNLQNTATLTSTNGHLTLDGSATQTLTSSSALVIKNLTVNNSASGEAVTLAAPLTVGGVGTFTDGILKADATNLLSFADGATVAGAADASHVKGPVGKAGSAAFVFPLGNGTAYRPASVVPQGGTGTFTAEYRQTAPADGSSLAACLASVSGSEQWQIERTAGSTPALVGLAYENVATTVADPSRVRVARYTGSAWEALSCLLVGGLENGRVGSSAPVSEFGAFTLGFYRTPTLTVTYPSVGTLCAGQTLTLGLTTTGAFEADNAFIVQLSSVNGSFDVPVRLGTIAVGSSQTVTIPANTPAGSGYKLRVVSSQPIVFSNESSAFAINRPAPTIAAGGATTFCAGGSVGLSAGSFSSYAWKNGSEAVGTGTTYTATASGSYTVTVTDGAGCQGTSLPLTVTVNPLPNVSITGLATSYCQNAPALTLAGSPAGGTFRVDGNVVTQLNPASLSAGNHTVEYAFTDANGCTGTASQSVGIQALAFTSTPTVAGVPACAGQPITLGFAFNCPEGVAFTVQLSDAAGQFGNPVSLGAVVPGGQVVLPQHTPFGTGYRIRIVSQNPALTSAPSASFTVNTLGQVAVALFPATPSQLCLGDELPVTFSTAGNCPFPVGNVFTVQLSSSTGSFASPLTLGVAQPGTTSFVLPPNLPAGTGYRVRILSSNPAQTSAPSAPFESRYPSVAGLTPGVGGVPQGGICRGQAVTLSFSLPAGSCAFPGNNQFTAQLSSASGSFTNPVTLGPVQAGVTNPLTIPANSAAGTGYRIRVVSSSPVQTSLSSLPFRVNATGCNSRLSADPEYSGATLVIAPNPVATGGEIRLRVVGLDNPSFTLTTSGGRNVGIWVKADPESSEGGYVLTAKQPLTPGVYAVGASEGQTRITRRVLVAD